MTDLYGIRVLKKAKTTVTFRVFIVYPDSEFIPDTPEFFFQVLLDRAERFYSWKGGPLGDTLRLYDWSNEEWLLDECEKYIEKVEYIAERNFPFDPSDFYTFYYERDGKWQDEDKLPQMDCAVTVSDPRWIEHLEEGMSWGSTAYQF